MVPAASSRVRCRTGRGRPGRRVAPHPPAEAPRRERRARLRCCPMIDRAEVLHVARLARLALSDEEVERMSRELSAVLDHIEKISELDLEGVPPTSHVVEGSKALRADEPLPSLPREEALGAAPAVADDGFE